MTKTPKKKINLEMFYLQTVAIKIRFSNFQFLNLLYEEYLEDFSGHGIYVKSKQKLSNKNHLCLF